MRNKTFSNLENDIEDLITGRLTQQVFSSAKINKHRNDFQFSKDQMKAIKNLFPSKPTSNSEPETDQDQSNESIADSPEQSNSTNGQQPQDPTSTQPNMTFFSSPDVVLQFETNNARSTIDRADQIKCASLHNTPAKQNQSAASSMPTGQYSRR